MLDGKRILAVVPARSGSKGIPGKNLKRVNGVSLIGLTGLTLSKLTWVDAKMLSTDSAAYVEEGRRYGLEAPFLRPAELSTDEATAADVVRHALLEAERHYGGRFDIVLIVEPTSPLRRPADLERAARRLIETGADSVITVSPLSTKFHPLKVFTLEDDRLKLFLEDGARVTQRQQLGPALYWRNGVCYALTRACVLDRRAIVTGKTVAEIIDRQVVNIDDPLDLMWAESLAAGSAEA